MTRMPYWMVTSSSKGIGRAGQAGWMVLYIMGDWLTIGDGRVESFSVRIQGQTNNADVIMGVYSTIPMQDNNANGLFFEKLKDTSKSTALVLTGDFNLPETN